MAMTARPVLNGVELPRPSSNVRTPEPVEERLTLAGGGLRTYHRGFRSVFELAWASLTEDTARDVQRAATARGAVRFTDQDGTAYLVLCSPGPLEPIAGTAPTRFATSVTLTERTPR